MPDDIINFYSLGSSRYATVPPPSQAKIRPPPTRYLMRNSQRTTPLPRRPTARAITTTIKNRSDKDDFFTSPITMSWFWTTSETERDSAVPSAADRQHAVISQQRKPSLPHSNNVTG